MNQAKEVSRLIDSGNALFRLSNYTEALEAYNAALTHAPTNAAYLNNKGFALYRLDKYAEALEAYNAALTYAPTDAVYLNNKALALHRLGNYAEALEAFNAALTYAPTNAVYLNHKGDALYRLDKYEEALEAYNAALAHAPTNVVYLNNKGDALYRLDKYAEALEAYDAALTHAPTNTVYLNNKGNALQRLGNYAEALEAYNAALTHAPTNTVYLNNKGRASQGLGNYAEALETYNAALAHAPTNAVCLNNKGTALQELAEYQAALNAFDKALQLAPNNAFVYKNKGGTLYSLSDFDKALSHLDEALRLKPDFTEALIEKIFVCLMLDTLDKEEELIKAVLKIENINKIDLMLVQSVISFKQNKIEEGLGFLQNLDELCDESKDKFSKVLDVFFKLANSFIHLNQYDLASKYIQKAKSLKQNHLPILQLELKLQSKRIEKLKQKQNLLKNENLELNQENQHLNNNLNTLQISNENLKSTILEQDENLAELQKENDLLNHNIRQLTYELKHVVDEAALQEKYLLDKNDFLFGRIEDLNKQIADLDEENFQLKDKLVIEHELFKKAQVRLAEDDQQLDDLAKKLASLQLDYDSLRKNHVEEKEKFQQAREEKLIEIVALKQTITTLENKLEEIKYDNKHDAVEQLKQAIEFERANYARLEENILALITTIERQEQVIEKLKENSSVLLAENKSAGKLLSQEVQKSKKQPLKDKGEKKDALNHSNMSSDNRYFSSLFPKPITENMTQKAMVEKAENPDSNRVSNNNRN